MCSAFTRQAEGFTGQGGAGVGGHQGFSRLARAAQQEAAPVPGGGPASGESQRYPPPHRFTVSLKPCTLTPGHARRRPRLAARHVDQPHHHRQLQEAPGVCWTGQLRQQQVRAVPAAEGGERVSGPGQAGCHTRTPLHTVLTTFQNGRPRKRQGLQMMVSPATPTLPRMRLWTRMLKQNRYSTYIPKTRTWNKTRR